MKLIVGLGNPGKEYEATRHNVGFAVVDLLAQSQDTKWKKELLRHAQVAKLSLDGLPVLLAKPTTYMNESGRAVAALVRYYKIATADLLVVQDDMDLPEREFKFYLGGRAAGHHGIESIQQALGTDKFMRLRIGIGRPTTPMEGADWVLSKIKESDYQAYEKSFEKDIIPKIIDWVQE